MARDIIERIQRLFPDLDALKQRLAMRLQDLDSEIGVQVRGQERAIIVGKDKESYVKLSKLLERDLISAELTGVDRIIRGHPVTDEYVSALETIVDESMPFLVIRNSNFNLPTDWRFLEAEYPYMQDSLKSVGRIGNAKGQLYWGTGFLVAPDVIMTNWHVIYGHVYPQNVKWEFYPHLNVEVDFRVEYQTQESFKVRCIGVIGRHAKYDLALLRLEKELDTITPLILSSQPPQNLQGLPIYLIGHPYIDSRLGAIREIQRRLFLMDQTIGYKHVLLGYTESPIRYQPDLELDYPEMPYFCHTGSTLPGNSGSCVIDAESHRVIGLHCAGDNRAKRNYAVPLWELRDDRIFTMADIRFA